MGLFGWLFGFPSAAEKKMCRDKVRYTSYPEAQAALDRINPGRRRGKPIRYYKCPKCNGYHITRSPAR